jgi:hypothetical protein
MFPVPPRPVVYILDFRVGVVIGSVDGDWGVLAVMLPER